MPHWPCFVNLRGLARTAAVGLMKASFRSLVMDSGRDWPCHFWSAGLGIEQIHLAGRAFHEQEDDVLGFRRRSGGFFWARADCASSRSATRPSRSRVRESDRPIRQRIRGRMCGVIEFCEIARDSWLFPCDELVEVQKHAARYRDPRRRWLRHALATSAGHELAATVRELTREDVGLTVEDSFDRRSRSRVRGLTAEARARKRSRGDRDPSAPARSVRHAPSALRRRPDRSADSAPAAACSRRARRRAGEVRIGRVEIDSIGYGVVRWKWM